MAETETENGSGISRLRVLGYVAFGAFFFLISLYVTFPSQAVGQRLAHEVGRQSRGAVSVSIEEVSPYRLSGVAAEGVRLRIGKRNPVEVRLDAVRMRLRLLPLLLFSWVLDADVQMGDGRLEVDLKPVGGGALEVEAEFEDLDFLAPPILPKLVGMPVRGAVTGALSARWNGTLARSGGEASVTLAGAGLGPGSIQGFSLPEVGLGNLEVALQLGDGKLEVTRFGQTPAGGNPSFELRRLQVSSNVRSTLRSSTYDICLETKADASFLQANPKLATALELAQMQLRKDEEDFLHVALKGSMGGRPRPRRALCPQSRGQ